jgi:hypothetical protein
MLVPHDAFKDVNQLVCIFQDLFTFSLILSDCKKGVVNFCRVCLGVLDKVFKIL